MPGRVRIFVPTCVLLSIAAACGISAVGQGTDVGSNAPDSGTSVSSSSGGTSSSGNASSSGTTSSSGGGSSGDGGDSGAPDATADVSTDAAVVCPSACTGGCDGGCIISGGQAPTCPPGVARCEVSCVQQNDCDTVECGDAGVCHVVCTGPSVCNADTINCGTSACTIRCVGKDACNSTTFQAGDAASLCVSCNGDPACNGVTCARPMTCTKQFLGGGDNTIGGCNSCPGGACL